MAQENARKFLELMRSNEELQQKVNAATEAYIGDKMDEKALFEAVIAPVAKEAGLDFGFDDMKAFADEELTEEELTEAAGGLAVCSTLGVGTGKSSKASKGGIGICKYVGIGWGKMTRK